MHPCFTGGGTQACQTSNNGNKVMYIKQILTVVFEGIFLDLGSVCKINVIVAST